MAIDAVAGRIEVDENQDSGEWEDDGQVGRMKVIKKPPARPKSYHQILNDFQAEADGDSQPSSTQFHSKPPGFARDDQDDEEEHSDPGPSESFKRRQAAMSHSVVELSQRERQKRENTTRRHKRFSLPAVALQTTSVMTRTSEGLERSPVRGKKRFSLVLGRGGEGRKGRETETSVGGASSDVHDLGKGVAAGKLNELLGRGGRVGT
jgi:FYVE, RhoGEF and PH domain containing 5/6